jgi:putative spermidine/putrescine transport system permease protein
VYLLPRAIWDGISDNVDPSVAAVATLMILVTATALAADGWFRRRRIVAA